MAPYNADLKLIAVTGPTGAGKTTFINQVCGSNLEVGNSLRSCTTEIEVASCEMGGNRVVLIDTPGFDDTTKSQADVLNDIGQFLKKTYEGGIMLTGVIYLHRISDRRMGGIARENFRLFRKICGASTMRNVFIVTTMWDDPTVTEQVGQAREQELQTKDIFFQPAIREGARMVRHQNGAESARSIASSLLARRLAEELQMQHELVEERKSVPDTAAGLDLFERYKQQEARHQQELRQLRDDMVHADQEEMAQLRHELKRTKEELKRIKGEEEKLRGGFNGILRFLRAGRIQVLFCVKVYSVLESR